MPIQWDTPKLVLSNFYYHVQLSSENFFFLKLTSNCLLEAVSCFPFLCRGISFPYTLAMSGYYGISCLLMRTCMLMRSLFLTLKLSLGTIQSICSLLCFLRKC